MIKKQTKSFFCNSCRNCPNQGLCISATAVTKGLRKYFLNINGKREPTNLAMLQGKEFHETFFKHQKEIQEIGFNNLQRDLFAGKPVDIKELRVCVHPNTNILTQKGAIKIKEIDKEKIINKNGRVVNAIKSCKNYKGKLINIKILGNQEYLKCTPDHKIYVIQTNSCKYKFKDKRFKICWKTCSGINSTCSGRPNCLNYKKRWINSNDLKINDLVIIPKLKLKKRKYFIETFDKNDISYKRLRLYEQFIKESKPVKKMKTNKLGQFIKIKNSEKSTANRLGINLSYFRSVKRGIDKIRYMDLPKKIRITNELMELFGLYIAEGGLNKYAVIFTYHENEKELHNKTKLILKKVFKIKHIREVIRNSGNHISFTNRIISNLFRKEFYNGKKKLGINKCLPNFYLNCTKEQLASLIKGYWYGDGTYSNNCYSFSTISKTLVYQLKLILSLWGIYPTIIKKKNNSMILGKLRKTKPIYNINITGQQTEIFRKEILKINKPNKKRRHCFQKFYQDKDYFYIPIKKIKKTNYIGKIYDLTVKDGHSYIANNILVHNCSIFYSVRGIIDSLRLQLDLKTKTLNIEINELKTSFWKEYIFQLALYGLLFSDPNFKVIIPITKRKTKLITKQLIPPNLNLMKNIKCRFIYKNSKPYEFDFMINNELTDHAKGLCVVVQSRLVERRKLHGFGLKYINEVKPCKHCMKEKCGLYLPFCSKIEDDFRKKTKQLYLAKNKLLKKTKPIIKRSEIRIK